MSYYDMVIENTTLEIKENHETYFLSAAIFTTQTVG